MNAAAAAWPPLPTPPTPVSVVQRQLEAYNARDLDAFMAVMADDVVAVDAETGALIAEGAAALRPRYEQRFSTPVHCELLGASLLLLLIMLAGVLNGLRVCVCLCVCVCATLLAGRSLFAIFSVPCPQQTAPNPPSF